MPVIRIAEIPNAGPRAVGASSANIGVPNFGGLTVNPQVAQLTGAAALSDASVRRSAQSMLSQTLQQNAFTAEAEAGMRLGQSIGQIGGIAQSMAEKFGKAKDTADLARAETVMRAAFEKQQNEQLGLPVDQWEDNWKRNLEQTQKAMAEIKFSNNAAQEFAPSWQRWTELSNVQIQGQARKKQIEGYQMDVDANAAMKVASEDLTGAFAIYERAEKDGIFSPEEAKMRKARIYDDQVRLAKEQNYSRVVGEINTNAWDIKPMLEKRSQGQDVPELGDITPVQATSLLGHAESVIRGQIGDMDDAADQAVLTGEIKTPKELREKYPNLPERRLLVHEATMKQVYDASPEAWAKIAAARPKLMAAIETYDPAKDDQDMTGYFAVKDTINSTMPPGEKGEFLDLLSKKRREGNKLSAPVQDAVKTLDQLSTAGWFGQVDPKKLASTDPAVRAAEAKKAIDAGGVHADMQKAFLDWANKHPEDARDGEKVRQQLKIMVDPKAAQQAMDFFQGQVQQRETEEAAANVLNFGSSGAFGAAGGFPLFNVTPSTRDQLPRPSAEAPQVSLDFNDVDNPNANGVEVVVRKDATAEEKRIANNYTSELTNWFASKGVQVQNRGIRTKTWQGFQPVGRFHTEPFFAKDKAARQAIIDDAEAAAKKGEPSEYAQLLVRTLGTIPNITFIAPHEQKGNPGASADGMSEREFARKYIIPSLELIKQRQGLAGGQ